MIHKKVFGGGKIILLKYFNVTISDLIVDNINMYSILFDFTEVVQCCYAPVWWLTHIVQN